MKPEHEELFGMLKEWKQIEPDGFFVAKQLETGAKSFIAYNAAEEIWMSFDLTQMRDLLLKDEQ